MHITLFEFMWWVGSFLLIFIIPGVISRVFCGQCNPLNTGISIPSAAKPKKKNNEDIK